jgi:hypothetical protein
MVASRFLSVLLWTTLSVVGPVSSAKLQRSTESSAVLHLTYSKTGMDLWDEPWVFAASDSRSTPLVAIDSIHGINGHFGSVPIRLADGRTGSMSVDAGPCGPLDACIGSRDDCGCMQNDSYWIRIADIRGRTIRRLHFWAAYGRFQIVPVDILEGPGNELLIFRMHARAVPPTGYDIKIWEIHQDATRDFASEEQVAGQLPAVKMAVPCVYWKTRFTVDTAGSKPRPLRLRIDVRASADCSLQDTAGISVEALQPRGPAQFDKVSGKYVFPALSGLLSN